MLYSGVGSGSGNAVGEGDGEDSTIVFSVSKNTANIDLLAPPP